MLTSLNLGYGSRLANQMFKVAGTIGLAKLFGHGYAFPYWKNFEHKDVFGSTEDIDVQSWFKNKLPVTVQREGFQDYFIDFNTKFEDINIPSADIPPGDFNITEHWSGHLQSERYFAHCKDLIRHYFEFDEEKAKREFNWQRNLYTAQELLPDMKNTCGIHVRIGDYAKPDSWQPVMTTDYYHRAMELMPFPTTFIVFSDEPGKAKQIIEPTGMKCLYIGGNHYIVDLWLMTQCKNFIIANSTYSWWGAWLINNPDKKIIAPSTWWKPEILKQWNYSTKDLFPKEWIVI